MKRIKTLCLLLCVILLTSGCEFWNNLGKREEEIKKTKEAVPVKVMKPVSRDVIDYEEFTGETFAVDKVDVQAQVSGYLSRCCFNEGAEVHAGELLFEIEPEVYQAIYDSAVGELNALKSREPQLKNDLKRNEDLLAKNAVSQSDYDLALANYNECLAKVEKAEADVEKASINLKYTKIVSPVNGYISRKLVTEGNLIQADSTHMAKIVSIDPVYVYFYIDETSYLKLVSLTEKRAAEHPENNAFEFQVEYRLSNENAYTNENGESLHVGTVFYSDPYMDQSSGTILFRATCPNPKSEATGTLRPIVPGMFVHVRIPVSEKYSALLVPEEALGSNQGIRYVYVVTEDGKAQMRPLVLGPLQGDNMRVVRSGIQEGDTVIVDGLLRLRPDVEVNPKEVTLEELRLGL